MATTEQYLTIIVLIVSSYIIGLIQSYLTTRMKYDKTFIPFENLGKDEEIEYIDEELK